MVEAVSVRNQALGGSASQESVASTYSHPSSFAGASSLQSSGSNLSISTNLDTASTSPASSIDLGQSGAVLDSHSEAAMAAAAQLNHIQTDMSGRVRTPDPQMTLDGQGPQDRSSITSPMAVEANPLQQLHQPFKRTASGSIKLSSAEGASMFTNPTKSALGHSRSSSAVDSANRYRIAELSVALKTRLSYAMVKVQHGWENRSLDELEQSIPSPSAPTRIPMTPTFTNRNALHPRFDSSSTVRTAKGYGSPSTERSHRYAHSPDAYPIHSPASQPALLRRTVSSSSGEDRPAIDSPRTYASFWAQHERNPMPTTSSARHHTYKTSTSTVTSTTPSLAPAADVVSSASKRRSQHGRPPLQLPTIVQGATPKGHLMTPRTPRQNLLRMPSQQAEKDAVDTLLFMSSPNNSGNVKHVSQHGSPLRSDFPAL